MRNWSFLTIIVALAGCSWLSSPTLPTVATPQRFNSDGAEYTQIESLPYLAWWQQFKDPQLDDLIESSLSSNLDVKVALSNLEQAQGQLRQVQLSWIPFVNLYGGFSSNPGFGAPGTFYGIWPQYTLNIAQLIKQQELANYNLELVRAMVDGVRLTLIGQVSSGYFTLIAQQEQLRLLNQLNADLTALISLRTQEIKIGIKDTIFLAELISQQKLVHGQLAIAEHNILLSQNSLRYLLNQNPGQIKTTNNFAELNFARFKPGELPANVLQNRPDLKIAEYSLKAAHTNVGVAYASLFPALQLDSFFGGASASNSFATPANYAPFQDEYVNWGINPSTFGKIEAGKGAYQAQVYKYIQTVRKILQDVDNAFSANRQYSRNYQDTQLAWQDLANKYQLQQGLYKIGTLSYPQLLESKIILDNLILSVNQARLQQAISLVNLYQDLAGGYKYHQSESTSQLTSD